VQHVPLDPTAQTMLAPGLADVESSTATTPGENETALNGDVAGPGCTTFSVSR
jgi:hypothetical protein